MASDRPHSRTGWTLLIVPPNPLRKTRAVHIGRRDVRAALAIAGLCTLSIAGLGVIVFSDSLQVTATADELADAHQMILTLTDSLQSIRSDRRPLHAVDRGAWRHRLQRFATGDGDCGRVSGCSSDDPHPHRLPAEHQI